LKERRVILFAVAALLLIAAVGGVFWYLSTADERAERDVEEVDVLVATAPISAGTTGQVAIDNDWVGFEARPRNSVPDNIVRSADDIEELVAAANVSERQFITSDTFVSRARASSGGALVGQIAIEGDSDPSPRQAVAITLDGEKTVDSNVLPGDTINIVGIGEAVDGTGQVAGYLLTDVPVIGQSSSSSEGEEAAGGGTVIVSLPPDDILRVLSAKTAGVVLWLTLVPPDYDTAAPPPIFLPSPIPIEGAVTLLPFS